MATKRKYAYYIKGNKIAIIQREDTVATEAGNFNNEYGIYKSPIETIADGLEIQYAYSPEYFIDETDKVDAQIDTYVSLDGLLKIIDQGDNDYSASPESLSDGSYIVLKKAGKWNGLHRVKAAGTGYITLYTKCSDSSTVQQSFEETIDLYYNIDVLNDEEDTIDLPLYLTKALILYVKAKVAEDAMNIEAKEYLMKEFRKMIEKHENGKIWGARQLQSGTGAIR